MPFSLSSGVAARSDASGGDILPKMKPTEQISARRVIVGPMFKAGLRMGWIVLFAPRPLEFACPPAYTLSKGKKDGSHADSQGSG